MTIQNCYEKLGGDYQGVLGRLGSDALVQRFLIKFLSDTSFQDLKEGIEKQDPEEAFRGAHTLKGVCMNLAFDDLFVVSDALTELLRGGELAEGYEELFEKVEAEYKKTIAAIREFSENQ